MKSNLILFASVVLLVIFLFSSISGATSTSTTINASGTKIALTSNGTVNSTVPEALFNKLTSPVVGIATMASAVLFALFLIIGEIIIFKKESQKEKINYTPFVEYALIALLILFIPEVVNSYTTTVPTLIKSVGTSTLTLGVIYETDAMIIIAIVISFAGFIIFIKRLTQMLVDYTDDTKREQVKSNIGKIIMLLVFIIFSPYILIILFLGLSHLLVSINNSFSLSMTQTIKTSNLPYLQLYQTSYTGCASSPQFWQIGKQATCIGNSLLYMTSASFYSYSLQINIYKSVIGLITTGFSDVALNQFIFSFIFGIVMVVSFAVLDFKILKYLESINTEKEQESFREIKAKIIQFSAFMLSPTLYIVFLIIVGGILSVIVGMIFSTSFSGLSFSPIPALFTLIGFPTTTNIVVAVAGIIGLIFLLLLIAIVGLFSIIKIFASGLFSITTYWYFSDAPHVKAFGERLFYIMIGIFILPVFIIFFYSIFFGLIPSLIHGVIGGGTLTTGSVYGYTIAGNSTNAVISGPGISGLSYSCNSQSSLSSAITYLNQNAGNSQNALGALLYSCQSYIGGYATSVLIVDVIFLIALIIAIIFLITGGASVLTASFAGLGTSIKSGNITEAFSTLANGTGDILNKATKSPFLKPIITAPKQAYTYAKMPLAGTAEGALLEGTVGTVGAFAMAVPNTLIEQSEKREKKKLLEQAIRDEMNQFKSNNKKADLIEKMLDTLDDKSRIAFTAKLDEHKGNIHETIKDIHWGKDERLKQATNRLVTGKEFKQLKALEEMDNNPKNTVKIINNPEYSNAFGQDVKDNIDLRMFAYQRAKSKNIPIKTEQEREQEFEKARQIRDQYKNYKDSINEVGEEFQKIDEGKGSLQEKKEKKEKIKLNSIAQLNKMADMYDYSGQDIVKSVAGSNNFATIYDTTADIYENTKELQASSLNLKTASEKQQAKENIASLKERLDSSVAMYGYRNVDEFIEKAQNMPAYKIAKLISNIKNSSSDSEKMANTNEFIKMLGTFGLSPKDISSIENNKTIQPMLMDAIEKMSGDYSTATSQELGELIKNGYMDIANPLMAKTISIPKGILSNVDTNLKAMIANPLNQTFKEYYGSIRKLVNTTWDQIMSGSLDDFISTLGEQTNYYAIQIERSKKEIQENLKDLTNKNLTVQERAEIENKIKSLKKSIMDAQTEININNRASSIYTKLPIIDSLLQSIKEWNVAGIDDVVSQYRLQGRITDNQIETIDRELEAKKKELADKQARIKNVKDSATEILLEMQIDKLKEKIEKISNEKEYLYAKQQGIKDFLNTDSNGVTIDEINKEVNRLNIKTNLNEKAETEINKNEELAKIIANYEKGKERYIEEKSKIEKIMAETNIAKNSFNQIKTPEDIAKINLDDYSPETKEILNDSIESFKKIAEKEENEKENYIKEINDLLLNIANKKSRTKELNEMIDKESENKAKQLKEIDKQIENKQATKTDRDNFEDKERKIINEYREERDEAEKRERELIDSIKYKMALVGIDNQTTNQYVKKLKERDGNYITENAEKILSSLKIEMLKDISASLNIKKQEAIIDSKLQKMQNDVIRNKNLTDYSNLTQVIKDDMKEELKKTMLDNLNLFPEKERDIIANELGKATKENIDDAVRKLADAGLISGEIMYPAFEKINNIKPNDNIDFNDIVLDGLFENKGNLDTMKDLLAKTKTLMEKTGKEALNYGTANAELSKAGNIAKDLKNKKKESEKKWVKTLKNIMMFLV